MFYRTLAVDVIPKKKRKKKKETINRQGIRTRAEKYGQRLLVSPLLVTGTNINQRRYEFADELLAKRPFNRRTPSYW